MSSKSTSELRATGREDPLVFRRIGVEGMRALDRRWIPNAHTAYMNMVKLRC